MDKQMPLVMLAVILVVGPARAQYCYSTDPSPYRHYGSKTRYDQIVPGTTPRNFTVTGCEPVMVYHLGRHGMRYPGDDDIEDMQRLLPQLKSYIVNNRSSLCAEDRQAIAGWTLNMVPDDDKRLAEVGWQEQKDIANRLKERFSAIYSPAYSAARYTFMSTWKERARDSARAFVTGLWDAWNTTTIVDKEEDDKKAPWYHVYTCAKYDQEVDDKPIVEEEKFKEGTLMTTLREQVSQRIGMNGTLGHSDLKALYYNCILEYGIFKEAPWCAVFTKEELKQLEYMNDIEMWYEDMYGSAVVYERACPIVKDILNSFKAFISGGEPHAVHRFGHTSIMNAFYARIGLFRDAAPPTADDFATSQTRKARASIFSPMSQNIDFVLYNCTDGFRVYAIQNEDRIEIPNCPSPCALDKLRDVWKSYNECDADEICKLSTEGPVGAAIHPRISIFLIVCLSVLFYLC